MSLCSLPVAARLARRPASPTWHRICIWIITFLCYTSYHLSRKPISIVKNALDPTCNATTGNATDASNSSSCDGGWAPFNGSSSSSLLGALDYSYLFAYAVGMFLCGHIAERMDLRHYLTMGMIGSGIMTALFGLGYTWNIHSIGYFIAVQIVCGLVQSSGWPGVVSVMGNWFGKSRRGLIMGVWNSHTSLGNILGTLIASAFLTDGWLGHGYWAWSFIVPGAIIASMGVIVFFCLIPEPQQIGVPSTSNSSPAAMPNEEEPLINDQSRRQRSYQAEQSTSISTASTGDVAIIQREKPVSFLGALLVPGVIEYSLCLFFAKLVTYTFLYWLPKYIEVTMSKHTDISASTAGDLSTCFDLGGIAGAIAAGLAADLSGRSALTCAVMLIGAIPSMYFYNLWGAYSFTNAIALLLVSGALINGPYCLITTSVSADLGTHESLRGNGRALATVTAIIDGTGSAGAALGPLLVGLIEDKVKGDWDAVFYMLIGSNVAALLLLARLVYKDVKDCRQSRKRRLDE